MVGQATKWRGQCIQSFAELELIIETTLRDLADRAIVDQAITVGTPVGQAFKQMRKLTGARGPFASDAAEIHSVLEELARWFEWRAHLTHGVLKMWLDDEGAWLVVLSHRSAGDGTIRSFAISWQDARLMQKELTEKVSALRTKVPAFLKALKANSRSLDPGGTLSA